MTLTASIAVGGELLAMHKELLSRGVNIDTPWFSATLKFTLMGLGTILTLVFFIMIGFMQILRMYNHAVKVVKVAAAHAIAQGVIQLG